MQFPLIVWLPPLQNLPLMEMNKPLIMEVKNSFFDLIQRAGSGFDEDDIAFVRLKGAITEEEYVKA